MTVNINTVKKETKKEIFSKADILLPKESFEKWAVIACDQHTSDIGYWGTLEEEIGNSPSSLKLILPEVYLSDNAAERIEKINTTMKEYTENGVFKEYPDAIIYIERRLTSGKVRKGVVGKVDLEEYDYKKNAKTPIRATEATVTERIPPRMEIRKNAPLELPHIMLLIDDKKQEIIEGLSKKKSRFEKLYDFDLSKDGGHITGYLLDKESADRLTNEINALADGSSLAIAVGDGNHSLASAKECYEQNKTPLSRYALAEIVNIHDPSLEFEPIYRVLFGTTLDEVKAEAEAFFKDKKGEGVHQIRCLSDGKDEILTLPAIASLEVATLQAFIDSYIKKNPNVTVDYIHGLKETEELSNKPSTVGFVFGTMQKSELFPAVEKDGSLVRKTFSMGEACDKRYYIEARKIK